jgi:hypothetical protein
MSTGLIDRFRSLPMSRAAVLAGRTLADLLTQALGALVVAGVGLAIGWRIHTGVADTLAAFGLALLMGYAFTWAGACLGMVLRSPEAAQQLGFILFLPLTFISNAFVPTQGMPGWLQVVAGWNPLSALAAACRHLFGNPDPAASIQAWPMQHPVLAAVLPGLPLSWRSSPPGRPTSTAASPSPPSPPRWGAGGLDLSGKADSGRGCALPGGRAVGAQACSRRAGDQPRAGGSRRRASAGPLRVPGGSGPRAN